MSDLPNQLNEPVQAALRLLDDQTGIHDARSLGGGCINNALRLQTGKETYLLKWNADPLPGMFETEAHGLQLLAATHTVRVPAVYHVEAATEAHPPFILLEWLEGRSQSQEQLGQQLAELHRQGVSPQTPPVYGLDRNNYLGSSVQKNDWQEDWVQFFSAFRLQPQIEMARRNHRLPTERQRRLEKLIERLRDLLGDVERRPALIHGDLWGGNVIPGPQGLALIDPAVSYSDREAEIAYTELFGGFSTGFYAAYNESWPLDPGYTQRRDLYNLYHLLNHLNLFGESYGFQVDAVLLHYVE